MTPVSNKNRMQDSKPVLYALLVFGAIAAVHKSLIIGWSPTRPWLVTALGMDTGWLLGLADGTSSSVGEIKHRL